MATGIPCYPMFKSPASCSSRVSAFVRPPFEHHRHSQHPPASASWSLKKTLRSRGLVWWNFWDPFSMQALNSLNVNKGGRLSRNLDRVLGLGFYGFNLEVESDDAIHGGQHTHGYPCGSKRGGRYPLRIHGRIDIFTYMNN